MSSFDAAARRHYKGALDALAGAGSAGLTARLEALYAPGADWRGSCPIDGMTGIEAIAARVWGPLIEAMPDLERRDDILVFGSYEGRDYVAAVGHYCGTFRKDWLGIPATGRAAFLRYGEVHQVRGGRIVQSNCLWDVLDLMRQAEVWPLGPSLGAEGRWAGPISVDGVRLVPSDPEQGAASIAQTLAMHATLHAYPDIAGGRQGLIDMPQKDHWHPKMMWYGPSGIGTARGIEGFVDHHQLPFRTAFPRPRTEAESQAVAEARARMGGGHYIRIGDGPYSVTGGWPSRVDLHAGPDFLGLPSTGRTVGMRVMDFYLHDEGLIRENWVPLDILDLLRQLGIDAMGRMRAAIRRAG
ncbi:ester cyclase [Wenxinia saemankumensis]|uniref:SnoaL-like polyketide cyclase n=1 Tax=Wenxinia saemankumensis TaxID=1447782 RepID=A0A1M6HYS5_9RHOB|nr:ester cyclase [Wenxinia saemankumensis]SHJ27254.1 SnoaL-like polyketide cyclase [Wenxinia saemankumensis]